MRGRENILEVSGLCKYFSTPGAPWGRRGQGRAVRAVDGVSFAIAKGETLALVGESGSGKTTVGRLIVRLLDPDGGHIWFRPRGSAGMVDLAALKGRALKNVRREVQLIFQDPRASLNPRMRVREILAEPFIIHRVPLTPSALRERIAGLLASVGLGPEHMDRYPHQLSGGQRQRIGIARALALGPQLVVADEPVSALDVSVQGHVINLLQDLQERFGLTYLFISHDLAVVRLMSDRVAVMYRGRIVECGPSRSIFRRPKHPYTEALLAAIPAAAPGPRAPGTPSYRTPGVRPEGVQHQPEGDVPYAPQGGCPFLARCPYARAPGRKQRCASAVPAWREIEKGHWVACHFAESLRLEGLGHG